MKKLSKVALTFSILGLSVAGFATQSQTHEAKAITFSNCKEAWQAGYADILRGQDGYDESLDRDKDGIACDLSHAGNWYVPRAENPAPSVTETATNENPVVENVTPVNTVETSQSEVNNNVTAPVVKELPKTSAVK